MEGNEPRQAISVIQRGRSQFEPQLPGVRHLRGGDGCAGAGFAGARDGDAGAGPGQPVPGFGPFGLASEAGAAGGQPLVSYIGFLQRGAIRQIYQPDRSREQRPLRLSTTPIRSPLIATKLPSFGGEIEGFDRWSGCHAWAAREAEKASNRVGTSSCVSSHLSKFAVIEVARRGLDDGTQPRGP